MSEDFDKYLAIANHDIQMANDDGQLKSYVASILYDYDKKVELLQQKENIIKEVREYIESYNLEYLHETNEHNLADILEELLEILERENNDARNI